jgi:hypothetical protein
VLDLNPVGIQMEIWDQNSSYRLPVDAKLLTSPTHRLAWAVDNRVSDCSNIVLCPWWFWSPRVWLSVFVFCIEVIHSPMGSELLNPSADHWADRKFTTIEMVFESQLRFPERL